MQLRLREKLALHDDATRVGLTVEEFAQLDATMWCAALTIAFSDDPAEKVIATRIGRDAVARMCGAGR